MNPPTCSSGQAVISRPVRRESRAANTRTRTNAAAKALAPGLEVAGRGRSHDREQEHRDDDRPDPGELAGDVGVHHDADPGEPHRAVGDQEEAELAVRRVLAQRLGQHGDRSDDDEVEEQLEPLDPVGRALRLLPARSCVT